MTVDWDQQLKSKPYSFVATRGPKARLLADNGLELDHDLSPLSGFLGDAEAVGLVLVENEAHNGSGGDWTLQDARDSLNQAGYSIVAIIRDRVPVETPTASRLGFGEASTVIYGLEVAPMVSGEALTLRKQIEERDKAEAFAFESRRRTAAANRETTDELGKALARMRREPGWLEAERQNTMERRALASERRLAEIESSWTWRIGSAVLWLPRKFLALFGGGSK